MKRNIVKFLAVVALCSSLIGGLGACARTVPVENPSFTVLSDSSSHTASSIKKALLSRRWILVKESPGKIVARYVRGANTSATVEITYGKENVSVKLVDSVNLLHGVDKSGQEVIHKTYMHWVRNLERDIQIESNYK